MKGNLCVAKRGCTAAKIMTLTRNKIQFATNKCGAETVRSVRWSKGKNLTDAPDGS
jgi:hypothetical protein